MPPSQTFQMQKAKRFRLSSTTHPGPRRERSIMMNPTLKTEGARMFSDYPPVHAVSCLWSKTTQQGTSCLWSQGLEAKAAGLWIPGQPLNESSKWKSKKINKETESSLSWSRQTWRQSVGSSQLSKYDTTDLCTEDHHNSSWEQILSIH